MEFERNLAALRKTHSKLADDIAACPLSDDVQAFLCGPNEDVNLSIGGVPLHDVFDPFEEAMRIYESSVPEDRRNQQNILFQYGMGLGYLFKRSFVESKSIIIVYEPFLPVLRKTLEIVDFSKELMSSRVRIVTTPEQVLGAIAEFYLLGDNISLLSLPSYEQLDSELYLRVLNEIKSSLYTNIVRQNTALLAMEMSTKKALGNIPHLVKYPEVSFLHDKFDGVPGVLVSPGPSIDRPGVLDALRAIQDNVVISCTGQAAKVLDNAGITPDFTVILESRDVTNQVTDTSILKDINLVMLPQANEKLWELPTKRKLVSFATDEALTYWLSEAQNKPYVPYNHTGTVSISALLLLIKMGCNPIYMIGQDLAFPEGKAYSESSVYKGRKIVTHEDGRKELLWENQAEFYGMEGFMRDAEHYEQVQDAWCKRLTEVKGWNGETLMTDVTYAAFKQGFEVIGKSYSHRNIINCSEGGAFINNYEHKPFLTAIAGTDFTQYHPKAKLKEVFAEGYQEEQPYSEAYQAVADRYMADRELLQEGINVVKEGEKEVQAGLREVDDKKTLTNSLRSRLRTITEIDHVLTQLTETNPLINPFIQGEIFLYAKGYERKIHFEEELQEGDMDEVRENLKYTLMLYQAAEKGFRRLMEEMDQVMATFPAKVDIPEPMSASTV